MQCSSCVHAYIIYLFPSIKWSSFHIFCHSLCLWIRDFLIRLVRQRRTYLLPIPEICWLVTARELLSNQILIPGRMIAKSLEVPIFPEKNKGTRILLLQSDIRNLGASAARAHPPSSSAAVQCREWGTGLSPRNIHICPHISMFAECVSCPGGILHFPAAGFWTWNASGAKKGRI